MDRRVVVGIVLVLVVVFGAVAIGTNAYHAGIARGLEEAARLPAPGGATAGAPPYPYYGPHWYYGPYWHHGFGFGFLFPLLFLFLIFSLFKGLFWRRHWGHYGRWQAAGVPPMFEEWHRRAHEAPKDGPQKV
jgi:hypothetical protein